MHVYAHTHMHKCTHTRIRTYTHSPTHTHTYARTHREGKRPSLVLFHLNFAGGRVLQKYYKLAAYVSDAALAPEVIAETGTPYLPPSPQPCLSHAHTHTHTHTHAR